jgi:6,7-dimethyl-8-ribityllumazine synthase
MPTETDGKLIATGRRFAIAASRFNGQVVESLVAGAIDCLVRHGADAAHIHVVRCPGSWELPLVVQALALSAPKARPHGIVALGCVIRGETAHYDHVAGECCKGLAAVQLATRVPVGLGVLTCDTVEQAQARAGLKAGNKGVDAAMAVIEMVNLLERL